MSEKFSQLKFIEPKIIKNSSDLFSNEKKSNNVFSNIMGELLSDFKKIVENQDKPYSSDIVKAGKEDKSIFLEDKKLTSFLSKIISEDQLLYNNIDIESNDSEELLSHNLFVTELALAAWHYLLSKDLSSTNTNNLHLDQEVLDTIEGLFTDLKQSLIFDNSLNFNEDVNVFSKNFSLVGEPLNQEKSANESNLNKLVVADITSDLNINDIIATNLNAEVNLSALDKKINLLLSNISVNEFKEVFSKIGDKLSAGIEQSLLKENINTSSLNILTSTLAKVDLENILVLNNSNNLLGSLAFVAEHNKNNISGKEFVSVNLESQNSFQNDLLHKLVVEEDKMDMTRNNKLIEEEKITMLKQKTPCEENNSSSNDKQNSDSKNNFEKTKFFVFKKNKEDSLPSAFNVQDNSSEDKMLKNYYESSSINNSEYSETSLELENIKKNSVLEYLDNIEKISQLIKSSSRNSLQRVTIQLAPINLGKVILRVEHKSGVVSAFLQVEKSEAKAHLLASISQIRENLKVQGIELGELEIRQEGEQKQGSNEFSEHKHRRSNDNFTELENKLTKKNETAELEDLLHSNMVNSLEVSNHKYFKNIRLNITA